MKKIKLIIFDWDDVFTLGSTKGYFRCYHETLKYFNIHLDPQEEEKRIRAKWGQSHREELRELLQENLKFLDQACKVYEKKLFGNTFVKCLKLVSGSKKLLERLYKEYILCISTGLHPKLFYERIIPKFGIPDVFSTIISAYDINNPTKQKPNPYIVNKILKKYKVLPNEAALVGDANNDVLMAQAADIIPIVVLTGHLSRKEAEKLGVKYIISDVTKIEKILDKLNSS